MYLPLERLNLNIFIYILHWKFITYNITKPHILLWWHFLISRCEFIAFIFLNLRNVLTVEKIKIFGYKLAVAEKVFYCTQIFSDISVYVGEEGQTQHAITRPSHIVLIISPNFRATSEPSSFLYIVIMFLKCLILENKCFFNLVMLNVTWNIEFLIRKNCFNLIIVFDSLAPKNFNLFYALTRPYFWEYFYHQGLDTLKT